MKINLPDTQFRKDGVVVEKEGRNRLLPSDLDFLSKKGWIFLKIPGTGGPDAVSMYHCIPPACVFDGEYVY